MNLTSAYDVAKQTLWVLLPEWIVLATAIAMMTASPFVRAPRRTWSIIAAAALGLALLVLILLRHDGTYAYSAVALNDALAWYGRLAFLLTGLIVLGLAHDQVDEPRAPEFFGALLLMNAGAMLVASANEIVFLFVGLELVSIPTYLLLYLSRRNATTQEAATKYFYLSIFSSGLMLFGLAYLYGLTGVSNLKALAYLTHDPRFLPQGTLALIAVLFVTAGLGFRVAAVPFHFYAPDVYQGSPTVIAAVLAWIPKGIGFLALLRTLTAIFGGDSEVAHRAVMLAWIIAVVTMTLGNTVALMQENLKRLLAYSSIAHAGYLMVGVAVAFGNAPVYGEARNPAAVTLGGYGILFYLATYALMTLGAFGVIIALSTPERPIETVDDLAGLGRTHPAMALAMMICLFSLAGIPPLAGFYGKFLIFGSALFSDDTQNGSMYLWLAIIGVINAAIGAYYYLKIVMVMVFRPASDPIEARTPWPTALAVGACAVLTIILGIYPRPIASASQAAGVAAIRLTTPLPVETEPRAVTPVAAR